jgi:Zinc-binding dehydrogenase
LPDNCSFEDAALAEPLSVLIHATRRAQLQSGHSVLVYGVGTIGLLACALAKSKGASRVVAVDINESRLEFAKRCGFASDTYCLQRGPQAEESKSLQDKENLLMQQAKDGANKILSSFNESLGFDVVYECTGAQAAIQMSIHVSLSFSVMLSPLLRFPFCICSSLFGVTSSSLFATPFTSFRDPVFKVAQSVRCMLSALEPSLSFLFAPHLTFHIQRVPTEQPTLSLDVGEQGCPISLVECPFRSP